MRISSHVQRQTAQSRRPWAAVVVCVRRFESSGRDGAPVNYGRKFALRSRRGDSPG
jgi:hypothetical protein